MNARIHAQLQAIILELRLAERRRRLERLVEQGATPEEALLAVGDKIDLPRPSIRFRTEPACAFSAMVSATCADVPSSPAPLTAPEWQRGCGS